MFMLVIYIALDDNSKDQLKYMHKKATTCATSIRVGNIQQNKSRKALNSTKPQTLKYLLAALTLNEKECKHILQHIIKFGLTKAGISSTLQTAVRYGPCSIGGTSLFYPLVIQGTSILAFLIEHYWKSTTSIPLL